jgi:hypothetical protein
MHSNVPVLWNIGEGIFVVLAFNANIQVVLGAIGNERFVVSPIVCVGLANWGEVFI